MSDRIPFLKPNLVPRSSYDAYLDRIDESHFYSNYGPLNTEFESRVVSELFQHSGAATTVNNATIGLMLAINEVKRPGARFALMPSFTFAATPLAAQWCGLEPYFLDVDPATWCMDSAQLGEALRLLGDSVAVIVPYASFGTALNLEPYERLHREGIPVVLDAAPCFGTMDLYGKQLGQDFPGLVVFSFHATKAFGIGEGGLVYSGDPAVISRIRQAGNFGFSSQRESVSKGLNSKISEYAAAIALATLDAYPEKVQMHQRIHGWYLDAFTGWDVQAKGWVTQDTLGTIPYQFMPLLCPSGRTNRELVVSMEAQGIECRTYFSPVCHQHPQFKDAPHADLRQSELLSKRILSLPLWEQMRPDDVARVVRGLMS